MAAVQVGDFRGVVRRARQDNAGDDTLSDGSDLEAAMTMLRPASAPALDAGARPLGAEGAARGACCIRSEIGDREVSLVLPVHSQPEYLLACMASVDAEARRAVAAGHTAEISLWDDWANAETHAALWQWVASVADGFANSTLPSRVGAGAGAVGAGASGGTSIPPACACCGISFVGEINAATCPGATATTCVTGSSRAGHGHPPAGRARQRARCLRQQRQPPQRRGATAWP